MTAIVVRPSRRLQPAAARGLPLVLVVQACREEREDLVACRDRGLACFVDEVNGHDAVRAWDVPREERRRVGAGGVVGEHSSDEAVAECLGVGRESLRRAEPIALEPVGQHR